MIIVVKEGERRDAPDGVQAALSKIARASMHPADRPAFARGPAATTCQRGPMLARKILVDMKIAAY